MLSNVDPAVGMRVFTFLNQPLDEFLAVPVVRKREVFQLAPGIFDGDSMVLLGFGCRFIRCSSRQPLLLRWVHRNEILLVFPLHERSLYCQGRRWSFEQPVVVVEGNEVVMWTPEGNDMLLILLSQELLQQRLGPGDAGHFLGLARTLQVRRSVTADKAAVTARVDSLFRHLCDSAWQESEPECRAAFGELMTVLYDYVTTARPCNQPGARGSHERIVQRALAALLANPAAEHSLDELCASAHCSRRALALAFEDICGLPPVRFARKLRLNTFRREMLQAGRPEELPILMSACGYSNHGRLNAEYRQLFGERPLETLRNHLRLRVKEYS